MPIYDYACTRCGHRIEVIHGIHAAGPERCPSCGAVGTMKKGFAPPAVHFKGSGWAKKDRRATASPGRSKSETKDKDDAPAAATPPGGESKASGGETTTPAPTSTSGGD